jgi:hypothetical protein
MVYDEKTKISIMKWRKNNREIYNSVCVKGAKKYNEEHKDEIREYKKQWWIDKKDPYKTESAVLRKMLI